MNLLYFTKYLWVTWRDVFDKCYCSLKTHIVFQYNIIKYKCSKNFPEYVRKYATEEALREQEQQGVSSDSESSMSDFSEDETKDMEL